MEKLKGIATIQLPDNIQAVVEIHWYEAHGMAKEFKIKRFLDEPPAS